MTPHLNRAATAAALALACTWALATPLDDIRRQVENSQFDQAYRTAQDHPQLIGDVHFDFLYGVAAINVGRVPEGLLALERHLSAVPANDRARLELGRGYFLLGEYTRARTEFEFVLRYKPPAAVREKINGFLQAMQLRESTDRRATARAYVEAGAGYDDNVNIGTLHDALQVGVDTLDLVGSPSRQVGDSFTQFAAGGQQSWRVSNRLSVFAGADLDHRANSRHRQYDISTAGVNAGFSQLSGSGLWRVTLGFSELLVGRKRYRDLLVLGSDVNFTFADEQTLTVFGQYGEKRHIQAEDQRDARSLALGAVFTQNWSDARWAPSLSLRASYTQEDSTRLRNDLSNKMMTVRAYGSITPMDKLRLTLVLGAYAQPYEGPPDIFFKSVRRDDYTHIDLLANYAIDNQLSIRGELTMSETRSNQDLFDSRRNSASLKLRYQF
ncbi:TPR_REGION domain-containing protein [Rubrivivax sp. A210]|uniref:tetratricopeptide repeat protein n=1 Tax=Rubrivivax sp. A210 TaxID=2772301 RepID=UPI001918233C|nr:hypothetical protein [Rubrivivax sp. A210]CAD5367127.1 TPR_REGION domain-containing protein [Rubrivivax sp. A210]